MKKLIAQAALISTFALGAIFGGGVALDGGNITFTGAESAGAMMKADPTKCWQEGDESGWYKDGAWVDC
jgi:hypothetical protein